MQNKTEVNSAVVNNDTIQIVSFNLGREEFALHIGFIQEIIKFQPVTPVPLTPAYVEGVINIRGNIIPVVDLRRKMNFPDSRITNQTRIIVVSYENRKVGLIVDNMNEVIRVARENIQPPPAETAEGSNDKNIEAICLFTDRLVSILDIEKILEAS